MGTRRNSKGEKGEKDIKVWDAVKMEEEKRGGGCQESESLSSQRVVVLIGGVNPANLTNISHRRIQRVR